jgi:CheY-like chemotaxis protein
MGGEIKVQSRPNYGSTFTIHVPAAIAAGDDGAHGGTHSHAPAPGNASANLVLVIDDDTEVLEGMQRILSSEGFTAIVAAGAAEGLRLATMLQPALILLDVLMPERDGWELLTMLKADERVGSCPVVMLTVDDNIAKSRALGADGHLVKPLNRHELMAVLKELGLPAKARDLASAAPVDASSRQAA